MMTNTRYVFAAVLVTAALTSGLGAGDIRAQQNVARNDECTDAGRNNDDDRETHCEVREFTVPALGVALAVNAAPNGGITVEGTSRQDISIRARVQASARTMDEARALANRIEIVATGERVHANGPQKLGRRESWSVSYRLETPRQTPLDLQSTNGGISLKGINSRVEFRTVNGGVSLSRVGGSIEGRTTNGGITVDLDGRTWEGQGLTVETTNGGVKLSVPEGYSAHLDTRTRNGGLSIDFPISVQGKLGRSISTDLGSGGPTLSIRTSNGGVRIARK